MKKLNILGLGVLAFTLAPALTLAAPLGATDSGVVLAAATSGQCQKDCPMGAECGAGCASCSMCEQDCHQQAKATSTGNELSASHQRMIERRADRPHRRH